MCRRARCGGVPIEAVLKPIEKRNDGKQKNDQLFSQFAFNFNLSRYSKGWKQAFAQFTGDKDMATFYAAFDTWAAAATKEDMLVGPDG
jgi:hypothetical protein